MMQVTKVWWDGEKLMAEPIDPASVYKEGGTCSQTLRAEGNAYPRTCRKCGLGPCIVYRVQPAQQEPVVWMYQDKSTHEVKFQKHMRGFVDHGATYETPLYTSPPPQRTWVGLTDVERRAVRNSVPYSQFMSAGEYAEHVQKATEFKLMEKNQ